MWITLEQIQCLQAVKESGSLNAASEKLHKAKSAIRYSITKLEEQVGFDLLNRDQYRIELTPQALAFLDKSQTILTNMEDLKSEVHKISTGTEMKLSMSATALYPSADINNVLVNLMDNFPSTEFTFHREILSGERMLLSGQVDIAIFENLQNKLDLEYKKIGETNLLLVIGQGHPFLKLTKKNQSLDNLRKYPNIVQRSTIANDFDVGIASGHRRWTVSDIDSKKDLILNNLGWGRLPEHYVKDELKSNKLIHLKHIKFDHPLELFIAKQKFKETGPVLKFVWDSF